MRQFNWSPFSFIKVVGAVGAILLSAELSQAMIKPQTDLFPSIPEKSIIDERTFTDSDLKKIIPLNMSPTDDEGSVAQQVLDHSLQSWIDSPVVQKSNIGRSAKTVEKSLRADVELGDPKSDIKHVLSFQMLAFQSTAMIKYRGLLDGTLQYKIGAADYNMEMKRPLNEKTDIVFDHIYRVVQQKDEHMDKISLKWKW